jgi:hypothetical protein
LTSIKYEVIRGLSVRAEWAGFPFSPDERQLHALSFARFIRGDDTGNWRTTFRHYDSFFRKCLQEIKALTAEFGDAEIPHFCSVHQYVQFGVVGGSASALSSGCPLISGTIH